MLISAKKKCLAIRFQKREKYQKIKEFFEEYGCMGSYNENVHKSSFVSSKWFDILREI